MQVRTINKGAIVRYSEDDTKVLLVLTSPNYNDECDALIVGTNEVVQISSRERELVFL